MTDAELVDRTRRGDEEAFELIMRRYNRRLFRIARSLMRDTAEAEDVLQETYVRAYERLSSFRGPDGFASWLSRILMNEALLRLKRRARSAPVAYRRNGTDEDDVLTRLTSDCPTPEEMVLTGEIRRLLEQAIDGLPDGFRSVFVLRAVEELSVAETAAVLGLKAETVKTRFHRARNLLHAALSERVAASLTGVFPFDGARCDRIVASVRERLATVGSQPGAPPP